MKMDPPDTIKTNRRGWDAAEGVNEESVQLENENVDVAGFVTNNPKDHTNGLDQFQNLVGAFQESEKFTEPK